MNEVVKYHNDLSNVSFDNFTSVDFNLFMTICSKCRNHNTDEIIIPFAELKKLAQYRGKDKARFIATIEKISINLAKLNIQEQK